MFKMGIFEKSKKSKIITIISTCKQNNYAEKLNWYTILFYLRLEQQQNRPEKPILLSITELIQVVILQKYLQSISCKFKK